MSKLQDKRREVGLTQKQLAEKSGVKLSMIMKYEIGYKNINKASAETVFKLAESLGCDASEILEEGK